MVDDSVGKSMTEGSSQTLPSQDEWETFDEPETESGRVNVLPEEKPPEGNGRYLSRLEKELQRLQEKKRKPLSSKDMIKTLQEAKDSHMKQLMEKTEQSEAFLADESDISRTSCCFPLYRAVFPQQPLSNDELECLVDNGGNEETSSDFNSGQKG